MAKTKISEFSSTPGNNTDIDSINLAEGCAPSGINDAIRELMAQLKDFQTGAVGDSFNGPVGTTTAAAGAFTTLTTSSTVTHNGGTANGVAYLNGSKVLTTGSALTFDGTNLALGTPALAARVMSVRGRAAFIAPSNDSQLAIYSDGVTNGLYSTYNSTGSYLPMTFFINDAEQMRLTSTGLGIGTSSPDQKLAVAGRISISGSGYTVNSTNGLVGAYNGNMYLQMPSGGNLQIWKSTTDAVALFDQSGNLGLGVTPSAWGIGKTLQVNSASLMGYLNRLYANANTYFDGTGTAKYIATDYAASYQQLNGQHQWFTAPSGTAGNAISFTQAMTLDASGRHLVGLTSSQSNNARLQVKRTDATNGASTYSIGWLQNATGYEDGLNVLATDQAVTLAADYAGTNHGTSLIFATNSGSSAFGATERARIDSSGNLLVGTTNTNPIGSNIPGFVVSPSGNISASRNGGASLDLNRYTSDGSIARFNRSAIQVGSIDVTTTATTYSTSSDYRLKNITGPITNSGAYIDSLNPVEGTWKADGSTFVGLIAHEVQEASRTQVATGVKDGEEMQGMDYSSAEIIANLIAEVKSLRQRLAAAGI